MSPGTRSPIVPDKITDGPSLRALTDIAHVLAFACNLASLVLNAIPPPSVLNAIDEFHPHFLRNLSPLAWIPFAILWFGIGDGPAIFLIFMASFAPMTLAIAAAMANIPSVYFQVGRDYGLKGPQLLTLHLPEPAAEGCDGGAELALNRANPLQASHPDFVRPASPRFGVSDRAARIPSMSLG